MKHRIYILSLCLISITLITTSCKPKINKQADIQSLIKADKDFSKLSYETGSNNAFLHFIDSSAVMLRDNSKPVEGEDSIRKLLTGRSDEGYKLTWEPKFADVSNSGELGYTYGIYELWLPDENGKFIPMQKGTYVTIWKKAADGSWKWVLDSGNEGLEEK